MADPVKVGDGDVPITIDGKDYMLTPSYKACSNLARNGEGLSSLIRRCANLELDVLTRVVAEGLGRNPPDLGDKLYKSGLRNMSGPCIDFLVNISNGGKPVPKEEGERPLDETA